MLEKHKLTFCKGFAIKESPQTCERGNHYQHQMQQRPSGYFPSPENNKKKTKGENKTRQVMSGYVESQLF